MSVGTGNTLSPTITTTAIMFTNRRRQLPRPGLATLLILAASAAADTGDLDPSFGNGGIVLTNLSGEGPLADFGRAVAIQADGKTVVAGRSNPAALENFALSRFNPDGSPDASFGPDGTGTLTTELGGADRAYGIAIDGAGNIVVVGESNLGHSKRSIVVRYLPNGTLDPTFGVDGVVSDAISNGFGLDVALQPDGRILVAVAVPHNGDTSDLIVARYHVDGQRDATFGTNGLAQADYLGYRDVAYCVTVDGNGRIIVGGTGKTTSYPYDLVLARFMPGGLLDTSFGVNGLAAQSFGSTSAWALDVMVDSAGRVAASGKWGFNNSARSFVIRYTASGGLDAGFAAGGVSALGIGEGSALASVANGDILVGGRVDTHFGLTRLAPDGSVLWSSTTDVVSRGGSYRGHGMAVDSIGRAVVAGTIFSPYPYSHDFAAARFLSDGSLDTGFGTDGIVVRGFVGDTLDRASDIVALQSDGKIVVAGVAVIATGRSYVALARYNQDGGLDPTFDGDGIFIADFEDDPGLARSLLIQDDGKIVVIGISREFTSNWRFTVMRLHQDGSLDQTFGTGGRVVTAFPGYRAIANNAVLQMAGGQSRLIVAGTAIDSTGRNVVLAAYDDAGMLDPTFGDAGKVIFTQPGSQQLPSIVIAPGDRVVVAFTTSLQTGLVTSVAAFDANGQPDTSFGMGGYMTTDFGGRQQNYLSTTVGLSALNNGKILIANTSRPTLASGYDAYTFTLARLHADGAIDESFGTAGFTTTDLGDGVGRSHESVTDLSLQPDGEILISGYQWDEDCGPSYRCRDFIMARYLPDGLLDSEFGTAGFVITDLGGYDTCAAAALDSQGRILLTGTSALPGDPTGENFAICRYLNDIVVDTDGDGLLDSTELEMADGGGCPDPFNPDSDGDTLLDGEEVTLGTDPCLADTDGDGVSDNLDPTPNEAGVPCDFIQALCHQLAGDIAATMLSEFNGPNDNANEGRRSTLVTRVRNAGKHACNGESASSMALIVNVRQKLDGEDLDWMYLASLERMDLLGDVDFVLLQLQAGQ